jgi:GH35 family endo-1,4-beta-xylanase
MKVGILLSVSPSHVLKFADIRCAVVKWENIEPEPNQFAFGPADEIVSFAESVGAKMRGHNFMWCVPFFDHCPT